MTRPVNRFDEFNERLTRSPEGWYKTNLPWKANHAPLPRNKEGSLRRLKNLGKKLQQEALTAQYDAIIQDQLREGIIEKAPPVSQPEKGFYILFKSVIGESGETMKLQIVFDASAQATSDTPMLNDCLYPGPALQNKLWDVLIQQRAYPVVLAGDIKSAFLQIRIHKSERNALHFHWLTDLIKDKQMYRFTRVLLGLAPSPYLLGGVLECHLETWAARYPEEVERLRRSFYVDGLLTGSIDIQQTQTRKKIAQEIMRNATFELHKWHSNQPQLEDSGHPQDQSFAKQQLQVKPSKSKLLGVKWNKIEDTIAVQFPSEVTQRPNLKFRPK